MLIKYTTHFRQQFALLPHHTQMSAVEKQEIIQQDPFDDRLQTIALEHELEDFFTFAIDKKYRILGRFETINELHLIDIANYHLYKKI